VRKGQIERTQRQELVLEVLRKKGSVSIAATGTSMLPGIWPGDLLRIELAVPSAVTRGDIVVFERDDRLFIHRVQQVHRGAGEISWMTRGDSLTYSDPPFTGSALLGRVTTITHNGREIAVPTRIPLMDRLVSCLFRQPLLHTALQRLHAYRRRASGRT
jgi:signal peptidase I